MLKIIVIIVSLLLLLIIYQIINKPSELLIYNDYFYKSVNHKTFKFLTNIDNYKNEIHNEVMNINTNSPDWTDWPEKRYPI